MNEVAGASDPELLVALLAARAAPPGDLEGLLERGLVSASPRCREAATKLGTRHLERAAPLLLAGLAELGASERSPRLAALARDPLLRLESRYPERVGLDEAADGAPPIARWFGAARVGAVLRAAAPLATEDAGRGPTALDRLRGLAQLLGTSPLSPLPEATRAAVRSRYQAGLAQRFAPQLAIVPSYACNRQCSFCFSAARAVAAPARIGSSALEQVLETVDPDRRLVRLSFFGGEPTQLPELMELLAVARARGLRVFFSTNGICAGERFAAILSLAHVETVTLHVDPPADYAPGDWEILLESARILGEQSCTAVIRYNLTDPAHRDFSFLEPVLRRLPRARVSFAPVFPDTARQNTHVVAADLARFAAPVLALVDWLSARRPAQVPIALAKPFPPCAFTPAELTTLLGRLEYQAICEVDRAGFTRQLHVEPDLTVSPCMALSGERFTLGEAAPLDELGARGERRLRPLLERPLLPACERCLLFTSGTCQAACFAYAD